MLLPCFTKYDESFFQLETCLLLQMHTLLHCIVTNIEQETEPKIVIVI